METICALFDNVFWTANFQAGGTALQRPATPQGVTTWGLRTLWAYWIDNHIARCEQNVVNWLNQARQRLPNDATGAGTALLNSPYMQPGGIITAQQMHFPQPNPASPLPGTTGSKTSIRSKYGLWGGSGDPAGQGQMINNAYGPLGI